MMADIKNELYLLVSATNNSNQDEKAKQEKARYDKRKEWVWQVSGEGSNIEVKLPGNKTANKKAMNQLQTFVFEYVKTRRDATKKK
jgi:hypothetical protein